VSASICEVSCLIVAAWSLMRSISSECCSCVIGCVVVEVEVFLISFRRLLSRQSARSSPLLWN